MSSVIKLKYWLHTRTQEQRIGVLLAWFIVCISIWYIFWENSYLSRVNAESDQLQSLNQKITSTEQEISSKQKIANNPVVIQKHKQLVVQLKDLNAQLQSIYTQLVSPSEMVKAMKDILEGDSGLKLLQLSNTGTFPLTPAADAVNANKNNDGKENKKLAMPEATKNLYRHNFTMVFSGNYVETLNYFKKIEKLPWKFYWDSVDYQVTKYPEAQITIKLHTVSASQEVMNA